MDLRSPLQAVPRKRCECDHVSTDGADTGVLAGCFRQSPSGGCLCPAGFLPVAGCVRQSPSGGWLCPAVFLPAAGCVRQVSFRWLVVSGRFRPSGWLCPAGFLPVAGCVRQVPSQRLVVSDRFPSGGWLCPIVYFSNSGFCLKVYLQPAGSVLPFTF